MLKFRKKFLILSEVRSGSTTLTSVMKFHPEVNGVCYEPDLSGLPRTLKGLDRGLENCGAKRRDCIKLMFWQSPHRFVAEWARQNNRLVILLERQNAFRAVVSHLLAEESGLWNKGYLPDDYRFRKWSWRSKDIVHAINHRIKAMQSYKDALQGRYFHLFYEDLYLSSNWENTLLQIFEYVVISPIITKQTKQLMANSRINDEGIYRNIDNVYQLEREIGSNKNGWLLNCCPPML